MMTWIWIEGHNALCDFCERRFKESRIEWLDGTIGKVANAKAYLAYKRDGEGKYHEFYLLAMSVGDNARTNGRIRNLCTESELYDKRHQATYEEIKADPTSILRR